MPVNAKKTFVHGGGRIMGPSLEPSVPCFVMKIYFCTVLFVLSFVLPAYVMHAERGRGIWDGLRTGAVTSLRAADFWREPKGRAASSSCLCPPGRRGFFPVPAKKLARLVPGLIGFTLSNSCWGFSCASASLIELIGICTNDTEEEQPSSQPSVTLTC